MKNSEKAINFLSLMSCSINKLKSLMFFAFKKFMFSDYMWKKIFAARNGGGGRVGGWRPPAPYFSTALVCVIPIRSLKLSENLGNFLKKFSC